MSLSVIFLIIFFFGSNKGQEKDLFVKGGSFIEGLKIVHKKSGASVWTLNAKRADMIEGSDKVKLNDVVILVENKGMTIYAPDGVYDMGTRNLSLNGKIKSVSEKGYTIETQAVEWDQAKGGIKTKENVRIESKKFNVEGSGMETDSEQKVRILNNVRATFNR